MLSDEVNYICEGREVFMAGSRFSKSSDLLTALVFLGPNYQTEATYGREHEWRLMVSDSCSPS